MAHAMLKGMLLVVMVCQLSVSAHSHLTEKEESVAEELEANRFAQSRMKPMMNATSGSASRSESASASGKAPFASAFETALGSASESAFAFRKASGHASGKTSGSASGSASVFGSLHHGRGQDRVRGRRQALGGGSRCKSSEFDCNGDGQECKPKTWLCDGDNDCSNGKDEYYCVSSSCYQIQYPASTFGKEAVQKAYQEHNPSDRPTMDQKNSIVNSINNHYLKKGKRAGVIILDTSKSSYGHAFTGLQMQCIKIRNHHIMIIT